MSVKCLRSIREAETGTPQEHAGFVLVSSSSVQFRGIIEIIANRGSYSASGTKKVSINVVLRDMKGQPIDLTDRPIHCESYKDSASSDQHNLLHCPAERTDISYPTTAKEVCCFFDQLLAKRQRPRGWTMYVRSYTTASLEAYRLLERPHVAHAFGVAEAVCNLATPLCC